MTGNIRESIHLLHTSSGCRSNVVGPYTYINKTVGEKEEKGSRERDSEICMHDWQYARKSKRARKRE